MLPTLGPPAPSATGFTPLPQTPTLSPPAAPAAQPFTAPIRRDGSATRPIAGMTTEEYVPPPAFRQILVREPATAAAAVASPQQPEGYQRPGLPERATLNPFGDDPLGAFLGGDAGVAAGLVPGEQRGGSYRGIATTPITLANFSTWGRERILALALSAAGSDYQQPEGARFGEQPTGPQDGGGPLDWFTSGVRGVGDLLWNAIDAPMTWFRNSNAFNRGKNVRELFQRGGTEGFIVEKVTSSIFGGAERFTIEGLQAAAARQGIDLIDATAKLYDMSPAQVAAIASDPWMSDQQLGEITDGTPLSYDPGVNLALEGAMLLATMAIGGAGVGRLGAKLAKTGVETIGGAFGAGLRGGAALAPTADRALQLARLGGTATRRVMQINKWNTVGGWTVGGAEWGIKQLALIGGNEELVKAMDRLMWQMPLSMNPGWNLIDGFSSHPIRDLQNLRRGGVEIGTPGTPGYVGRLDLRSMSVRDADGRALRVTVGGKELALGSDHEATRLLSRLRDLSPEEIHGQFFARPELGYSFEELTSYFGDGNPWGLTWDDARNGLFHMALEAVREGKGQLGRLEGLELPTQVLRGESFARNNAKGALRMLEDNFSGKSSAMVDLFRSDGLWDLAAKNDSSMAAMKAPIGPWDKRFALADFASWLRASKIVREAIAAGHAQETAVAAYRRTLNRDFLARFRQSLAERFAADEVVPPSVVNELKRYGGFVEGRGRGRLLTRGNKEAWTRRELEAILDDVERVDDEVRRAQNTVPRETRAAYARDIDPGVDINEDARVAGISPDDVNVLRQGAAATTHASLPPQRLVAKIAKDMGRSVDSILSLGPDEAWKVLTDWFNARLAAAAETSAMRNALDDAAVSLRARMDEGRLDPALGGEAIAALERIRNEMLSPLDPRHVDRRPHLFREWTATLEASRMLAQELGRHLDDPRRALRVVDAGPGLTWVLPRTASPDALRRLSALIVKVSREDTPFLSPAERDRLLDATLHPLLKAEMVLAAATPGDLPELRAILAGLGGEPRTLALNLVTDAGLDPADLRAGLIDLTGQAVAYGREADDLAGQAVQLAQRFKTVGGMHSDELADTLDRTWAADPIYRAAQPRGRKNGISTAPMDPEDPARQQAANLSLRRREAEAELAQAEANLARAQRMVDDPTAWTPPRAEDLALHRRPLQGGRFTVGPDGTKRAQAEVFAAAWQADHPEDVGRVMIDRVPRGYEVRLIVSGDAPRTAPVRATPAEVVPFDTLEQVRRLDDEIIATDGATVRDDFEHVSMVLDRNRVIDPAYAPEEMARVEAYVRQRRTAIERDLAANPALDSGVTDPRTTLLSILDERIATFDQRKANARRPVAEPAAPGQDVGLRAEGPGDTAAPRADESTQPGALEQPGPQEPPPVAPPLTGAAGSFQDPTTEASRQIGYELRVVEADSILNSWDEGYPGEYQMRDRRQNVIDQVAAKPDPLRLLRTETSGEGTPVMLPDGTTVFAGNHRAQGIRDATEEAYLPVKAALIRRAAEFGLDPGEITRFRKPVLVRVLPEGVASPKLALAMNRAAGGLTAENIARTVADAFTPADWATFEGGAGDLAAQLLLDRNVEFFRRIQSVLPESERARILQTVDGRPRPTDEALGVAKAALVGRALGDPTSPLVRRIAQAGGRKGAYPGGVAQSAGALLDTIGRMERGERPMVPFMDPLREALDLAVNAPDPARMAEPRDEMRRYLEGLFETPDPVVVTLAETLLEMESQAEVARFLKGVSQAVDDLPDPSNPVMDLFGDAPEAAPPPVTRILNESLRRMNQEELDKGTAFPRQYPLVAEATGETIVRDAAGTETARLHPVHDDEAAVIDGLTGPVTDLELVGTDFTDAAARITATPGRIILTVDTAAEAEMLTRYLAGDDSAALPANYRVVNGVVEDLPTARAARAHRLIEDQRLSQTYKDEAHAYIGWIAQGRVGDPPPARPQAVTRVEGYWNSPTTADPRLPRTRKALEGRDYEVRVAGQEPVSPPAPEAPAPAATSRGPWTEREPLPMAHPRFRNITSTEASLREAHGMLATREEREALQGIGHWYSTGRASTDEAAALSRMDAAQLADLSRRIVAEAGAEGMTVGKAEEWFRQNRDLFDGLDKRAKEYVPGDVDPVTLQESIAGMYADMPEEPASAPPPAPAPVQPTRITKRKGRRIDPRYEERTGLAPEAPAIDRHARESAAGTAHTIVSSSDEVSERAAQRAAGAPVEHQPRVIEMNRPGQAAREAAAIGFRDAAQARVDAARSRLERTRQPDDVPPPLEVLMGEDLALYHRYIAAPGVIGEATRQPRTLGEALSVLESLDIGMPPITGTMTPAEMAQLRGALMRVVHARLDDLGAPRIPGRETSRARAGSGITHARRRPSPDEEPSLDPEDMSADLAEVMRTLQSRVWESDDPLAGWEGTQYEIGQLPRRARDGGPLSPRIQYDDWVRRLDQLVPGLGDEVLTGRKRAWTERDADARLLQSLRMLPGAGQLATLRKAMDTAVGARPEREIVGQAIDRFTALMLRHFEGDVKEYQAAVAQVHGIIAAWHEVMGSKVARIHGFPRWRRIGLMPSDVAEEAAMKVFGVDRPAWFNEFLKDAQAAGIKHPIADAWREADNRIRGYFASRPGGMRELVETVYGGAGGRRMHELGRGITVFYHLARFLIDLRWLGLEAIEAPTLVLFREGFGAMWEGMGKGKHAGARPLFMGQDVAKQMGENWAWWIAQSDPGLLLRTRERYLLSIVRRSQEQEFPRALEAFVRGLERSAENADLAAMIRASGDTPMGYLRRLDADWELAASRSRPLERGEAERLFKPWLDRGVISPKEYDEFVKAGRWTGHPLIDRELAYLADPRMQPLIERLGAINEQGWNDAAKLIFGQVDRSNLQRLMNHPLLYWPISYQIKATKWLAGLLFDRSFGFDTGSAGAVTLGMLHEMHKDRMANDPDYANAVVSNPTLLFFAQMFFPITPWDIGVGLSPFTRLALSMATEDDPSEGYRRNIFSVGPGYTYFSLLPRLLFEQSKPGSWAQSMRGGILPTAGLVSGAQRIAPYSVPVAPTKSELGTVERQVYGAQPAPETPDQWAADFQQRLAEFQQRGVQ